jgi:WD repeat and SOF domain-containing protein 1
MAIEGLPLNSSTSGKTSRSRGYWAYLPIPGVRDRLFRIWVPHIPPVLVRGRKRRPFLLLCLACFFITSTILFIKKHRPRYPQSTGDEPSTLVFRRNDLQHIWAWEIDSGHYPSRWRSKLLFNFSRFLILIGFSTKTDWFSVSH